jgi:RNA-directed DNA polymerase
MHDRGKSDDPVVPAKLPNNAQGGAAEVVEGSGSAEGNAASETRSGPSAGPSAPSDLDRVRRVARKGKDARFTALLHHVDVDRLRAAYWAIRPKAAPGVDGVTWTEYGQDLEANLRDLHARVHRGSYRARPSRRVFIPKADGRLRPLGVAALEDKILQRALVEVLNAIYEADFLGFSFGFRPGRSPHDALDALAAGITRKKVNWVLDTDFREFFTSLDHRWLERFLEHRIADRRVLRLIQKWMAAGVIEDGAWTESLEGVPQGASASPLLANVYLHYVFDLWAHQWRVRRARGDVVIVRFADDATHRLATTGAPSTRPADWPPPESFRQPADWPRPEPSTLPADSSRSESFTRPAERPRPEPITRLGRDRSATWGRVVPVSNVSLWSSRLLSRERQLPPRSRRASRWTGLA